MSMTKNIKQIKFMIIKSKKITCVNFMYAMLNQNNGIKKTINGGWKVYYGLENNCKSLGIWLWDKKNCFMKSLLTHLILYGCEVWGATTSLENGGEDNTNPKEFYNL